MLQILSENEKEIIESRLEGLLAIAKLWRKLARKEVQGNELGKFKKKPVINYETLPR